VLNGTGRAADALSGLRYWTWDTEEILDLIEWMRWWNVNNPRKVKFYGFVMASTTVALPGLSDFVARVAPDLAATLKRELAPLSSDITSGVFGQLPLPHREAVLACIARVLAAFAQQRAEWVAATSALEWHLGRMHAIVLDRGARFALEPSSARHDLAMADNVCALLEAEGPAAKAVLWSHNAHAERTAFANDDNSMGKHLHDRVGRAQVVVGFATGRGSFQARAFPSGALSEHQLPEAETNGFERALAQAGVPLFALDLRNAPRQGPAAAWLASVMPMRSIGGIYGFPKGNRYGITYTEAITPREHFDAVIFVADSTAARRNRPISANPSAAALPAPANLALLGDGVPAGWQAVGAQQQHPYAIGVSQEPSPRGGRSVCIRREIAPWRWGAGQLVQKISARPWRGQKVRFAGAVRTRTEGIGSGALLLLKFLGEADGDPSDFFASPLGVVASPAQPLQAPQWAIVALEADVPVAAEALTIGLAMTGNGAAWFGDLEWLAVRPDERQTTA